MLTACAEELTEIAIRECSVELFQYICTTVGQLFINEARFIRITDDKKAPFIDFMLRCKHTPFFSKAVFTALHHFFQNLEVNQVVTILKQDFKLPLNEIKKRILEHLRALPKNQDTLNLLNQLTSQKSSLIYQILAKPQGLKKPTESIKNLIKLRDELQHQLFPETNEQPKVEQSSRFRFWQKQEAFDRQEARLVPTI